MKSSRLISIILSIAMIGVFSIFVPILGGCGKKGGEDRLLITIVDDDDSQPSPEIPGDTETIPEASPIDEGPTIRIGCWEGFLPEDLLDDFEKESGISVEIHSPQEPFDPMVFFAEHGDEYDLIMVDDFTMADLKHRGHLAKLDSSNLENLDNIDPLFLLHPYDAGRKHSVPIIWGTLGILVNRNLVTETNIEWDILFDPRYSGLIDMPLEHFLLFIPPLKTLGYSINERNVDVLEDARDLLVDQKEIIRGYYDHDTMVKHLVEGSSAVAYAFSWAGMTAIDMGGNVEYVVPKSGTLIWSDCLVIPKKSPNKSEAELFIDFLLIPDNMTRISNHLWTANTVRSSWDGVNSVLRDMEGVFIPDEILVNSEYIESFSPQFEESLIELGDELFDMDDI